MDVVLMSPPGKINFGKWLLIQNFKNVSLEHENKSGDNS